MSRIRLLTRLSNLSAASPINDPGLGIAKKTPGDRIGPLRALVVLGSLLFAVSALAQPVDLFQAEPNGKTSLRAHPVAAESWRITVDTAAIALGPQSMALDLPNGQQITARRLEVERRAADNLVWRGVLSDGGHATLTFVNGFVMGLIETATGTWELSTHSDGSQILTRVTSSGSSSCGNQLEYARTRTAFVPPAEGLDSRTLDFGGRRPSVDVMVLYTPQARDGQGGVAAIEAEAQAAVDTANTTFINSNVDLRFNLVHVAVADHDDSGFLRTDLAWVDSDPTVQTLRDIYQADMVSLWVEEGDLFGVSNLMGNEDPIAFAPNAFQVTLRPVAVSNLVYVHEHGHNLGLQHDPDTGAPPSQAFRPFAYGHFFAGTVDPKTGFVMGAFRTVMGNHASCPDCLRKTHFSNPDVNFFEEPTGIANERDNARTANITAPFAENWRRRFPGPAACPDCLDFDTTATVSFPGQDTNVGPAVALDDGATFALGGNRWQQTSQTFTIESGTVLELEFASTAEGEIHGIGFEEDGSADNAPRIFQLFGNQSNANTIRDFDTYSTATIGTFVKYTIPVGQFYTGSSFRLVFANDQDGTLPNNTSLFRNVRITNSAPSMQPKTGLWWNPNRSGNGIDFVSNDQGGHVLTWFTYTASGTPIWYQSAVGPIGSDDRFEQDLFQYTLSASGVEGTPVGSVELDFSDESTAQFHWQLDGASGSEPFKHFGGGGGRSGLWFPPGESGWGFSALKAGSALVTTVYYYAGSHPRWVQGVGADVGTWQTIDMVTVDGSGLCPGCGGNSTQAPPSSSAGTITLRIETSDARSGRLRTDISSSIGSWNRPEQDISKLAD